MSAIKINKTWLGSIKIDIFNKLSIIIGTKDSWGVGIDISPADKAITFNLIKIYLVFESYYAE